MQTALAAERGPFLAVAPQVRPFIDQLVSQSPFDIGASPISTDGGVGYVVGADFVTWLRTYGPSDAPVATVKVWIKCATTVPTILEAFLTVNDPDKMARSSQGPFVVGTKLSEYCFHVADQAHIQALLGHLKRELEMPPVAKFPPEAPTGRILKLSS